MFNSLTNLESFNEPYILRVVYQGNEIGKNLRPPTEKIWNFDTSTLTRNYTLLYYKKISG